MTINDSSKYTRPAVRLPFCEHDPAVLMQDWVVKSCGWWIDIPAGIETDGASIPRSLWTICGHPLEAPRVYAALVHDYLYSGMGPYEMKRADADRIYRDLLVRYGWGAIRSWMEYFAIRLFGRSHWKNRETNKETK